jgi:hypothetical protein
MGVSLYFVLKKATSYHLEDAFEIRSEALINKKLAYLTKKGEKL